MLLGNNQLWVLIIGALVPLVTYVLNRVGPWVSETVKAAVLVATSAAAGALYVALAQPNFGWNVQTRELVITAVVAALTAHGFLWKPAKVNTKLGASETSATAGAVVPPQV